MNVYRQGNFRHNPTLPEPANVPARRGGHVTADDDLLQRLAVQTRRIQSLERLIAESGKPEGRPPTVALQPRFALQRPALPVAERARARTWPNWPGKPMPQRALEPPSGHLNLHLRNTGAKVIAFAVFGLGEVELETEVARVAEQQALQGNFIPVFLTDSRDSEAFRRRGYVFEYFPDVQTALTEQGLAALQPRLDFLESKWGIDLFINLGLPAGGMIRRETRPPRERYLEAKARFSTGRFASAQALLAGFTEDTLAAAKVRPFGRQPTDPVASIVVVSHRDHAGVESGLSSIARQIETTRFEVILVDNGNASLARLGRKLFRTGVNIEVGFNAGCSGARNVGAAVARAPFLIFLDDDGITGEGCIDALIGCIRATGAVAVRGRVEPLTSPDLKGAHYDLGRARVPALITCEGVSVWKREAYLAAGGFDPLLAGHEGVALCARLWRFHGPAGFVYEPDAVLFHDYAPDAKGTAAKNKRYRSSIDYLDFLGLRWKELNDGQLRFISDPLLGYAALKAPRGLNSSAPLSVSVITTAKDARHFLDEYTASLKAQTSQDFEVIFVDDHSEDGTSEEVARLWRDDPRLSLHFNPGRGRGAALNEAMKHARGEICLIADVDDLSVPNRISLTQAYFAEQLESDCLSFVAFNEANPFRLGPPRSLFVDDLSVRQLFGMPVSFPTFAFRRERFPHPFDETLRGGIDCDWISRNGADRPLRGKVIFYPAVYYREHEGQITATRKEQQLAVRRNFLISLYERVLGTLSKDDEAYIKVLTESKQIAASQKNALTSWVAAFLQRNRDKAVFAPDLLDQAMFEVLREISVLKGK
jgi:glycosyltransferase involved in cell wall biosynthesis